MTKSRQAMRDSTGNLPSMPGIFPDYPPPIVRNAPDGRELAMARWGMPTPPKFLEGRKAGIPPPRTAWSESLATLSW
jgi:putative SOS response-associated peptidase YedK